MVFGSRRFAGERPTAAKAGGGNRARCRSAARCVSTDRLWPELCAFGWWSRSRLPHPLVAACRQWRVRRDEEGVPLPPVHQARDSGGSKSGRAWSERFGTSRHYALV